MLLMGKTDVNSTTLGKGKPTKKEQTKKPASVKVRPTLKKGDLDKLGKVSLKDKIQSLASSCESEEDLCKELKGALTPVQKSQIWNAHKKYLDANQMKLQKTRTFAKRKKDQLQLCGFCAKQNPGT